MRILSLILFVAACGPDANDPKSKEQVLLDQAIEALWGDVKPESVEKLRTRSLLVEKKDGIDSTFEIETLLSTKGRYREARVWEAYGLKEVFTTDGEGSWYLVDGTLVKREDEAEDSRGRDQNWLFEISKLSALKNGKRFDLSHEGKESLEDGKEVERLRVKDSERSDIVLFLDFGSDDHLVRRVVLNDERGKHSYTLLLDDYKPVGGVQFAHEIVQKLDGKPFARQTVQEIEINPTLDQDDFVAPKANAMQVVRKPSIGGWIAWSTLEDDDAASALSDLKEWITQNGLEIAGPMLVLTTGAVDAKVDPIERRLALTIKAPAPELRAKLPESEDFGITELRSQSSLCATAEGEEAQTEAVAAINKAMSVQGLKAAGPMVEVYFSRDGAIRQIQVPLQ